MNRDSTQGKVCQQCSQIQFDKMFHGADEQFEKRKGLEIAGIFHNEWKKGIKIHSFNDRLSQISECSLCQFFRTMRIRPDDGQPYDLVAFSTVASHLVTSNPYKDESSAWSWQQIRRATVLAVLPNIDTPYYAEKKEVKQADSLIFRSAPPIALATVDDSNAIWGRRIGQQVDLDIVMEWLGFCSRNHGHTCKRKAQESRHRNGLWLIDCTEPSQTIKVSRGTHRYVALSYVWGSSQGTQWPAVVRDAMLVTRQLGLKYLWVDRYCIDQNDPDEKHYMISQMASIYEDAELTIVAAAGADASFGLPGIGTTPRTAQPCLTLPATSITLLAGLRDPRLGLQDSTWNTRGWTYQEGALSTRLWVFTEDQVYWECGGMAVQEILVLPLALVHTRTKTMDGSAYAEELSDGLTMEEYMRPGVFLSDVQQQAWGTTKVGQHTKVSYNVFYRLQSTPR